MLENVVKRSEFGYTRESRYTKVIYYYYYYYSIYMQTRMVRTLLWICINS